MSKGVANATLPLTTQVSDEKIRNVITKCLRNVKAWGLDIGQQPVQWEVKKMNAFGETRWTSLGVKILLNQGLGTQSNKVIEDTIYHELAHIIARDASHGAKWKTVTKFIRQKTKLPLNVTGGIEDVTNDYWMAGYKYVVRCKKCGQMIGFNALNDLVRNPGEWDSEHNCKRFSHSACGGAWERVK